MPNVLCPTDEVLRSFLRGETLTPEPSQHTSACSTCQARLKELREGMSGASSVSADMLPPAPRAPLQHRPAVIGKYLVVATLGQGGQASAYRAVHPELGRQVAIKLSHREMDAGGADHDLLLAEGKLLAGLEHPQIARIHDLDFHEGRPYLVMEYVAGRTLREFARQDKPSAARSAALVAQTARAIAEAHRRGIVHQDLNPSNVMIDEHDQPRIIDFGIARWRQVWGDGSQPVGGTPGFMAPEQARCQPERIDQRTDIAGLGGILCYLLTGKAPYAEGGQAALDAPSVPRRLAAICRRALAPAPADRYASADALADALEQFLQRPRRRRLLLATAAAIVLLAGIGTAFALLHEPASPVQPPEHGPASPATPSQAAPQDLVVPDDDSANLPTALPLRSKSSRFHISCKVPRGFKAVLFYLDAEGKFEMLEGEIARDRDCDIFTYPAGGKTLQATGPGGTDLFLVCAHPDRAPRAKEVQALLGGKLPMLPGQIGLVRIDKDKVQFIKVEGLRAVTTISPTAKRALESRLENLRRELAQRFEFFAAVAVAHEE